MTLTCKFSLQENVNNYNSKFRTHVDGNHRKFNFRQFTSFCESRYKENLIKTNIKKNLSIQYASKSYYTVCFTQNFIQCTKATLAFHCKAGCLNYILPLLLCVKLTNVLFLDSRIPGKANLNELR